MQGRRDLGKEGFRTEGCRTEGCMGKEGRQKRSETGKEGDRKGGILVRRYS